EEVGDTCIHNSATEIRERCRNHARYNYREGLARIWKCRSTGRCSQREALKRHATRTRCTGSWNRERDRLRCTHGIASSKSEEVLNLKFCSWSVDVQRMRKVTCRNVDITARQGHVLREFTLNCEVTLIGVGVFKVLLNGKRKGKHWAKTRERLIVESLSSILILGPGSSAWSTVNSWNCARKVTDNDCPLEYLHCIE